MNKIDALNVAVGTEKDKQKVFKKYVPKELRHEKKVPNKNGKFVVKLKNGLYYNGNDFTSNKYEALIYNNYDDAKEVIKLFNAKIVKI